MVIVVYMRSLQRLFDKRQTQPRNDDVIRAVVFLGDEKKATSQSFDGVVRNNDCVAGPSDIFLGFVAKCDQRCEDPYSVVHNNHM